MAKDWRKRSVIKICKRDENESAWHGAKRNYAHSDRICGGGKSDCIVAEESSMKVLLRLY